MNTPLHWLINELRKVPNELRNLLNMPRELLADVRRTGVMNAYTSWARLIIEGALLAKNIMLSNYQGDAHYISELKDMAKVYIFFVFSIAITLPCSILTTYIQIIRMHFTRITTLQMTNLFAMIIFSHYHHANIASVGRDLIGLNRQARAAGYIRDIIPTPTLPEYIKTLKLAEICLLLKHIQVLKQELNLGNIECIFTLERISLSTKILVSLTKANTSTGGLAWNVRLYDGTGTTQPAEAIIQHLQETSLDPTTRSKLVAKIATFANLQELENLVADIKYSTVVAYDYDRQKIKSLPEHRLEVVANAFNNSVFHRM